MKWFWTLSTVVKSLLPEMGLWLAPQAKKTFQEGSNLDPTRFEVTWRPKSTPWESTTCPKKNQTNSSSGKRVTVVIVGHQPLTILFYSSCNQSTIVRLSIFLCFFLFLYFYSKRIIWSWWRVKQIFGRSELMRWLTLETRYHTDYCLIISTKVTQSWKANQIKCNLMIALYTTRRRSFKPGFFSPIFVKLKVI